MSVNEHRNEQNQIDVLKVHSKSDGTNSMLPVAMVKVSAQTELNC